MANIRENRFQAHLKRRLRSEFPGCLILKGDPNDVQGIPDILLLWREHWAALECKTSESAPVRPNQLYYIQLMDAMSFASYVNPDNLEEVIHELQLAFAARGPARLSERQQISLAALRYGPPHGSLEQRPSRQTGYRVARTRTSSNTSGRKVPE